MDTPLSQLELRKAAEAKARIEMEEMAKAEERRKEEERLATKKKEMELRKAAEGKAKATIVVANASPLLPTAGPEETWSCDITSQLFSWGRIS